MDYPIMHTKYTVLIDGTEMKSCDSRAQAEAWAWYYNTSPGCKATIQKVEWEEKPEGEDLYLWLKETRNVQRLER